jgi:glyoxylase-like metal-dependent hydrolase (beta-lactamase superfamily II)
MGFEIDFLAVGEGARSGDAIALRWGNLYGPRTEQFVMVVDGGNKDSGAALVDRIRTDYDTSIVDLVVNTHPDADHASGLSVVLEKLTVGKLWMHQPWNRLGHIHDLVVDGRITHDSLQDRIKEALDAAHTLELIATEKGIPM